MVQDFFHQQYALQVHLDANNVDQAAYPQTAAGGIGFATESIVSEDCETPDFRKTARLFTLENMEPKNGGGWFR